LEHALAELKEMPFGSSQELVQPPQKNVSRVNDWWLCDQRIYWGDSENDGDGVSVRGPLLHAGVACVVRSSFEKSCRRFVASWEKSIEAVLASRQRAGSNHGRNTRKATLIPGAIYAGDILDRESTSDDAAYYALLDKSIAFIEHSQDLELCTAAPDGIFDAASAVE
jgi:hypothetical protein